MSEFVGVSEVARRLGRSPATIRRRARLGDIYALRLGEGSAYRIPIAEVERLLGGVFRASGGRAVERVSVEGDERVDVPTAEQENGA